MCAPTYDAGIKVEHMHKPISSKGAEASNSLLAFFEPSLTLVARCRPFQNFPEQLGMTHGIAVYQSPKT